MLEIITIICLAQLVTYLAPAVEMIKKYTRLNQVYIFNCALCFAFWTALIYFTFTAPYLAPSYSVISGVGSELLSRLMIRLGI